MTNGNAELDVSHEPARAVGWTFLTNHALVLLTIARDPQITMRNVAAGYLTKTRNGRRNSYVVATGRPFRHPLTAGHDLDELLAVLVRQAK